LSEVNRPAADELPLLVDAETIGRMAAQWAKDNRHRQRARLEIVFEQGHYAVRMFEEAWGPREVAVREDDGAVR